MDIRPEALAFGPKANEYEKGRPDYPPTAIAWLIEALGINGNSTVIDLAAGTGKLTRLLLPTGARVIAIEPVEGMREVLSSVVPAAEVLEGTAEQLPLPDASTDAVTVAQAFHWFRGQEALAEKSTASSGREEGWASSGTAATWTSRFRLNWPG